MFPSLVILTSLTSLPAHTYTWKGGGDSTNPTSWSKPDNWSREDGATNPYPGFRGSEDVAVFDALVDEVSPERHVGAKQELQSLALAFDALSDKCRRIVWLRRIEGLSQRQTAERLGLREAAVESQLARGMRSLARAVFGANDAGKEAGGTSGSGAGEDE